MRNQGVTDMARGTGLLRHVHRARWVGAAVGLAALLGAGEAAAHLKVTEPAARHEYLKQGPCGAGADDPRGAAAHTFRPGQTITVTWEEFVDHPGHYRIAFDPDGQDDFEDPADFDDVSGGPGVLIDGIPDRAGGGAYSQEVTLPDVACDRCTLQVIQMMTDKPPYGDGNDLYYQCIDLVLDPMAETDATTGPIGSEDGCDCRAASGGGQGLLALFGLLRRRRRG